MSSLRFSASPWGRRALLPLPLSLLLLIVLSACGGGDKSKIVVAEVGDRVITLDYFERKMNSMDPESLPAQIETLTGKEELLDTMVDKEVMAIKAEELGFDSEGLATEAAQSMVDLTAVQTMKDELVQELTFVSDEEAAEYYQNLGRILQVSYMVFDFEEDALEGRNLVLGGESWLEIARRYNAGDPGPTGNWTMELKYGTIADDIETAVFSLNQGEVTEPLESTYGYFVIRLDGERFDRSLPPFEDIQENVARSVHDRKVTLQTVAFLDEVFEEFGYALNEEAVRKLYDALPPDQELLPVPPQENWGHLGLRPADMDLELMRYADEVWTLRRFYDYYEATPWLGRPRRDGTLGGLRRYLRKIVVRDVLPLAAANRGYLDRPEIADEFKERREEAMVTQLYRDLISADVEVTDEMVAEYWAENSQLYDKPIRHKGFVLISSDQEAVRSAYQEALAGADWDGLVMSYAEAKYMPQTEGGMLGPVEQDREALGTPLLWAGQAVGELCEPIEVDEGVWGIGLLEEVWPAEPASLVEAGVQVKRVLESRESERIFRERVDAWRSAMTIKIYPDRLEKAIYTPPSAVEAPAGDHTGHDREGEDNS